MIKLTKGYFSGASRVGDREGGLGDVLRKLAQQSVRAQLRGMDIPSGSMNNNVGSDAYADLAIRPTPTLVQVDASATAIGVRYDAFYAAILKTLENQCEVGAALSNIVGNLGLLGITLPAIGVDYTVDVQPTSLAGASGGVCVRWDYAVYCATIIGENFESLAAIAQYTGNVVGYEGLLNPTSKLITDSLEIYDIGPDAPDTGAATASKVSVDHFLDITARNMSTLTNMYNTMINNWPSPQVIAV